MAYYNGFPATYQPYYTQVTPVQQQQQSVQPSVQNSRIWVQGEAGAKSYLVAPNNTVDLWDSEAPVIYIKSADPSGLPGIKILDYTVRDTSKTPSNTFPSNGGENVTGYATKDEIEALNGEIKALKKKIDKLLKEGEKDE